MAKIISSTNCGNSPKMTFLKEFNIAFAKNNLDFIIENVTDEIVWNIIGDRKIEGREDFMDELKKMKFLKEFNIAFAKNNLDCIIENVTDEIVWNIIGDRKIEGREDFMDELKKMKSEKTTELFIDQILSHGKTGASNGIIKMQNGK